MFDLDLSVPLHHFTKRAKELLSGVRDNHPEAIARVRRVFVDSSALTDEELSADFGLMRAQHAVALEHGFPKWEALTDASGVEARLAITMAKHPELNDFGIGSYKGGSRIQSTQEKLQVTAENRETLRASTAAVTLAVTWLRENVECTSTVNKRHTSYGLKHMAEKDIGYITNGTFIAAGLIAGYPCEFVPGSPNVRFGMSEKSLKEVSVRRISPERLLKRFMPRAIDVLAKRGMRGLPVGREGVELAWLDAGDVRTLRIDALETTPFIVRLAIDHYSLFVSARVGKQLGVSDGQARPSRPRGEISVLPDELEVALEWALTCDAREGTPPVPPFETVGSDAWSYVWSRRASDRYASRRSRTERDSATEETAAPNM